ncbi:MULTISPECIES: sigma-54-dependent Fis family transcriptional regulator [unclassified Paenibacillus]|uniref:sigma-54-dependent Fis family transcriptional regulator n=1 Tax=unclassified Paenibacillus TaxID=185978 RepID=UPI0006D1A043|nr:MULTISPECIES: sigma-54-dependent Fis family transcriptional regulator [unclassified Paenibacillus]
MINDKVTTHIWDRFVREGVMDRSRISKRISESWFRCQQAGVNPSAAECKTILAGDLLIQQQEKNAALIDIAIPYMQKICGIIEGSGSIVLLSDSSGCVLELEGDPETLQMAKKSNIVRGVRWTEDVGTNAVATALCTGEALLVNGTEHYSSAYHHCCCAAAPIYDGGGTLIGILNVTSPVHRFHHYTFGLVVSIAYNIEQQCKIAEQNDEIELLQHSIGRIQSGGLVAVCTNKQEVVLTSNELQFSVPPHSRLKVDDILQEGYKELYRTPISSANHGRIIGYSVYFEVGHQQFTVENQRRTGFIFRGESGSSKAFSRTLREMELVAPTDTTVFLNGETGTGKEVIARAIHENSLRKDAPFIAVNCGAIAPQLMEAELFGYVEGAFTGAKRNGHKGKFEQANGGTLFLDEIGEISPAVQVALLRVLQEREITPVGGDKVIPLNFRLITATHQDLRELVRKKAFREDLYFRLFVYSITIPPLRDRREDIPHLVSYICKNNRWSIQLTVDQMQTMMRYHWPGNIRELVNVLERLSVLSRGENLSGLDIRSLFGNASDCGENPDFAESPNRDPAALNYQKRVQKDQIIWALEQTGGNVSKSAKLLALPRSTFYRRLRTFKLDQL